MITKKSVAVAVATLAAAGAWTATGSSVATSFTSTATGSISISTATWLSSSEECKKDGWQKSTNPVFKNQGDCVSSFEPSGAPSDKDGTKNGIVQSQSLPSQEANADVQPDEKAGAGPTAGNAPGQMADGRDAPAPAAGQAPAPENGQPVDGQPPVQPGTEGTPNGPGSNGPTNSAE